MVTSIDRQTDNEFKVIGSMQLDTVAKLYRMLSVGDLPTSAKGIEIDLGNVRAVDSAGLVLCLEWISQAQAQGRELIFNNVPQQMMRLARMNQVEAFFGEIASSK